MKGYFASLAKQSGLRVSGQKPGARVSSVRAEGVISKPLHREERVLVPPSIDDARTENKAAPRSMQKMDSPKRKSAGPSVEAQPPEFSKEPVKVIREEESGNRRELAKVEAASPDAPRLHDVRDIAEPRPATENRVSLEDNPIPEITVVEHREFVEQEGTPTVSAEPPDEPGPSPAVITETVERPRFFVKTAELIEKGEAGSEDIGNILFQEVRQWVAGGPSETDASTDLPEKLEALTVREVPRKETEPGTVVIRERIGQERTREPDALEEQNFDLSIGTISVIIEDPEKAPEPVQVIQNERSQNASTGTKREFSRLRRNYL